VQGFDIRGATDAFAVLGGIRRPAFVESIMLERQIVPALVGFTIDIPAPPAP
jgi:hypothetical protein